ncbi:unnamed protein product [Schistosoma curassoni]|uniref:Reverse transcriptase domain-containing protein n=1 Tax=Schistosoma curassoni TaxID=6186 RepID=A0A183KZU1_9TREM|nr:unnamed protein product [Schistosoma curassoni]
MQMDDLDFADDLALLSRLQQQMQEKTTSVEAASTAVGFNVNKGKSKIFRYNIVCINQIALDKEALEGVKPIHIWAVSLMSTVDLMEM